MAEYSYSFESLTKTLFQLVEQTCEGDYYGTRHRDRPMMMEIFTFRKVFWSVDAIMYQNDLLNNVESYY